LLPFNLRVLPFISKNENRIRIIASIFIIDKRSCHNKAIHIIGITIAPKTAQIVTKEYGPRNVAFMSAILYRKRATPLHRPNIMVDTDGEKEKPENASVRKEMEKPYIKAKMMGDMDGSPR